jgi:hypothetical protein
MRFEIVNHPEYSARTVLSLVRELKHELGLDAALGVAAADLDEGLLSLFLPRSCLCIE